MNVLYWLDPWEFSPTFLAVFFAFALLYMRGARRHRTGVMRQVWFWSGMALIYFSMQTYLDYYAEHELFVQRFQHLLLHHAGPFLIALAYPGPTLRAGIPLSWRRRLRPSLRWRPVEIFLEVLFNPWVATFLFVGVIYFWLYPPIEFVSMIDSRLYRFMNWSVTIDGILFWWLVLDHRPKPPARLSPGMRVLVPLIAVLPQLLLGSYIVFSHTVLYPVFEVCGRALPSISTQLSQLLAGIIIWIPASMMSVIASIISFNRWMSLSARHRLQRQEAYRRKLRGLEPLER